MSKKILLAAAAALLTCAASFGQAVGTGAYRFASFDNVGFDSVNLGNLNTRFSIPIVSKPGRGLGFNYSIQNEGLVWSTVTNGTTTAWVPDPNWGFRGEVNGISFTGYLTYTSSIEACGGDDGRRGGPGQQLRLSNYVYHDAYGANHAFNYTQLNPCTTSSGGDPTITGDGSSSDGSGYSLVNVYGQVRARNGTIISPPTSATGQTASSEQDSNGNTISFNGTGSFTDTLGTTPLTVSGSSPVNFTYPVILQSGGATTASATLNYKSYTVRSNFGCPGIVEYGSNTINLVDHISLADGSTYSFTYEGTPGATDGAVTARLASVTLPQGGVISYAYSGGCSSSGAGINADGTPGNLIRATSDGTRSYGRARVNGNATSTTLQDEKGNQTVLQFTTVSGLFYETHRQTFQGNTSGSLLLDRSTCYNGAAASCDGASFSLPITEADVLTSYNQGSQELSQNKYDTSGNLVSTTLSGGGTTYETIANVYNGYGEVTSSTVSDGSNNTVSQSTYGYDETAPIATSGLPQHTSGSGGNQTSSHIYYGSGSALSTSTTYYDTGMPSVVKAVGGFPTTYTYDSTGTFAVSTSLPTPSSGVSMASGASFDAASGAVLTQTGLNSGQVTTVNGYDSLLRPKSITSPSGGQISFGYGPGSNAMVWSQTSNQNGTYVIGNDAYGRQSRTAFWNGQSSNPWYQVDYCRDASGLLQFVPTTYQSSGFGPAPRCSGSGTSYVYDALGRVTSVTTDDGTTTTQYSNRAVKTTNVNGVQRITQYDILGRIAGVCEVSSNALAGETPTACNMDIAGTGFITSYAYDMASHTTTITQGKQTRTFQTDWAGRSTSVTEPERGTTTYSYAYNSGGLQTTRTRPQANQSNPSILTHTTTQYDALGRVVSVGYDDGLTDVKAYWYDVYPSASGFAGGGFSLSSSYNHGLLTVANTGNTATAFSYDALGDVVAMQECAPSTCGTSAHNSRQLGFSYDFVGSLLGETDPTSGSISYTRSPAGEITSVTNNTYQDQLNPANLISSVSNTAIGATGYTLGNGLQVVSTFDTLGRVAGGWVCAGSSTAGCNGGQQLYGFNDSWSGSRSTGTCDTVLGQCQTHGYDEFNRLTAVNASNGGGPGSYTYSYDRYGNRETQSSQSGGPSPQFAFDLTTNRNLNAVYDAAGNQTIDPAGESYTYDAEGNVLSVSGNGAGQYVYDALNHRVSVHTAAGTVEYLYDALGRRTSTWNAATNIGIEGRIYMDGKQIAFRAQDGQTYFEHQNWLGTERLRTNAAGQAANTSLSLAFGDGLQQSQTGASAQDNNQFAGLENDAESGTSHAQFRQYSISQGRWMSPDPYDGSYHFRNPQTFNRYAYAKNNPHSFTDHAGLEDDEDACDDPAITCYNGGGGDDGGGGGGSGGGGGGDNCPVQECVTTDPPPPVDPGDPSIPIVPGGDPNDCSSPTVSCVTADPSNGTKPSNTCDALPGFSQINAAAKTAISTWPVSSNPVPWLRGIIIHSLFTSLVRTLPQTNVNVSYKDGAVAGWLDFGSVRPDAVYGDVNSPNFIIELKTGFARLQNPQLSNYQQNLPRNTRICEIYESAQ